MLAGSKNRVRPLDWRHSVVPRNLRIKRREKVCVVMKQSAELRAWFYQPEVQVIRV